MYHIPVLLPETLDLLHVIPTGRYIDATLGGGGHTEEILNRGGRVLGIDTDQDAIEYVTRKLETQNSKFETRGELIIKKGNFRDIKDIATKSGFTDVDGILFDFGVSSHQLDTPERGFSFIHDGNLDMRMDKDLGVTAKDLIHVLSKKELVAMLVEFGEEPFAGRIAQAIVTEREKEEIHTTRQLENIVSRVVGKGLSKTNPATRVFQALRIAVNGELESIQTALPQALEILKPGGRLVTISFHSLEDRIVKDTFNNWEKEGKVKILTKKPVTCTAKEQEQNNRARSAKMRAIKKI